MNSALSLGEIRTLKSLLAVALLALCGIAFLGCFDIENPKDGVTFQHRAKIHFSINATSPSNVKWTTTYTDENGQSKTLDIGQGGSFDYDGLPIVKGQITKHLIQAKRGSDHKEVTIYIKPWCMYPEANCSSFGDGVCTEGLCDSSQDKCLSKNKLDGTACDDYLACTAEDCCKNGVCTPSGSRICPQYFICQEPLGCILDPNINCDDGITCTKDSFDVANGKCKHELQNSSCDDGNILTADICNEITGCWHEYEKIWHSVNGGVEGEESLLSLNEVDLADGISYSISFSLKGYWTQKICRNQKCYTKLQLPKQQIWSADDLYPGLPVVTANIDKGLFWNGAEIDFQSKSTESFSASFFDILPFAEENASEVPSDLINTSYPSNFYWKNNFSPDTAAPSLVISPFNWNAETKTWNVITAFSGTLMNNLTEYLPTSSNQTKKLKKDAENSSGELENKLLNRARKIMDYFNYSKTPEEPIINYSKAPSSTPSPTQIDPWDKAENNCEHWFFCTEYDEVTDSCIITDQRIWTDADSPCSMSIHNLYITGNGSLTIRRTFQQNKMKNIFVGYQQPTPTLNNNLRGDLIIDNSTIQIFSIRIKGNTSPSRVSITNSTLSISAVYHFESFPNTNIFQAFKQDDFGYIDLGSNSRLNIQNSTIKEGGQVSESTVNYPKFWSPIFAGIYARGFNTDSDGTCGNVAESAGFGLKIKNSKIIGGIAPIYAAGRCKLPNSSKFDWRNSIGWLDLDSVQFWVSNPRWRYVDENISRSENGIFMRPVSYGITEILRTNINNNFEKSFDNWPSDNPIGESVDSRFNSIEFRWSNKGIAGSFGYECGSNDIKCLSYYFCHYWFPQKCVIFDRGLDVPIIEGYHYFQYQSAVNTVIKNFKSFKNFSSVEDIRKISDTEYEVDPNNWTPHFTFPVISVIMPYLNFELSGLEKEDGSIEGNKFGIGSINLPKNTVYYDANQVSFSPSDIYISAPFNLYARIGVDSIQNIVVKDIEKEFDNGLIIKLLDLNKNGTQHQPVKYFPSSAFLGTYLNDKYTTCFNASGIDRQITISGISNKYNTMSVYDDSSVFYKENGRSTINVPVFQSGVYVGNLGKPDQDSTSWPPPSRLYSCSNVNIENLSVRQYVMQIKPSYFDTSKYNPWYAILAGGVFRPMNNIHINNVVTGLKTGLTSTLNEYLSSPEINDTSLINYCANRSCFTYNYMTAGIALWSAYNSSVQRSIVGHLPTNSSFIKLYSQTWPIAYYWSGYGLQLTNNRVEEQFYKPHNYYMRGCITGVYNSKVDYCRFIAGPAVNCNEFAAGCHPTGSEGSSGNNSLDIYIMDISSNPIIPANQCKIDYVSAFSNTCSDMSSIEEHLTSNSPYLTSCIYGVDGSVEYYGFPAPSCSTGY